MIRYKTNKPSDIEIPFNEKFNGTHNHDALFTGNGFTADRKGNVIPEFYSKNTEISDVLSDGAQLIRVENGVERVIGEFSSEKGRFVMIKGGN